MHTSTVEPEIYTVSRLNNEVRFLLEDTFPLLWVEGEVSNFSMPHSGHWYFCLKDAAAQIQCAMFKGSQRKLTFMPKNGMHILVKARVSLYEGSGRYQLIVEDMEERGEGKLRRAFELLKQKLEAEGLFDAARKRPLPLFPKQMGVITSATGAALRDILTVLKRRYPCVPVIIYPTLVQGETAAPNIVKAIQLANRRNECDVLILARGGGSLEDLWPFNEEIVARAIYQSELVIITGVGHEVDFTIADFVADKRAPTPSAAAELATPAKVDILQTLQRYEQQIVRQMQRVLAGFKQQLTWMQKHLSQQHPKRRLTEKMQHLDYCELTLVQLQIRFVNRMRAKLNELDVRLHKQSALHRIHYLQNQINLYQTRITNLMMMRWNKQYATLTELSAKLNAISPLATLKRGYAIAISENQTILRDVNHASSGDKIQVKLANGELDCRVEAIRQKSK